MLWGVAAALVRTPQCMLWEIVTSAVVSSKRCCWRSSHLLWGVHSACCQESWQGVLELLASALAGSCSCCCPAPMHRNKGTLCTVLGYGCMRAAFTATGGFAALNKGAG